MLRCLAGEWTSTRSAIETSGDGGKGLRTNSKDITLTAVFAALYVVINVLQMFTVGNPTIYGPIQLRIADCLITLAALIGLPVIGGVTLGCFVTNLFYFLGIQDVIFGPVANLVAAVIIFKLRKHCLVGSVLGATSIGLIVGIYLSTVFGFQPAMIAAILPAWLAMIVSMVISSLITVVGIGLPLLLALSRANPTKSKDLIQI
jgi:uncharacterized membrane protein